MGDEKSELLTTLASNPEIAVYRFGLANKLQFPFLPFFGACGRATFVQGPVVPLRSYLDQPLEVRLQLGEENKNTLHKCGLCFHIKNPFLLYKLICILEVTYTIISKVVD